MIKIQRLKRPTKKSGHPLLPGATTKVRGMTLVNTNKFTVWVDRFTKKPKKKK